MARIILRPALTIGLFLVSAGAGPPGPASAPAEGWSGYEGGNLHHNASLRDVVPSRLHRLWQRTFPNWAQRGTRNLVCQGGVLILSAADPLPPPPTPHLELLHSYLTLLDAVDGRTLVSLRTAQITTGHGLMRYPVGMWADARDVPWGLTTQVWDPHASILFLRGSGDNSANTAYLPLARRAHWRPPEPMAAVPAYPQQPNRLEPLTKLEDKPPDQYGQGGQNISGFIEVDDESGLIAGTGGHHAQASPSVWLAAQGDGVPAILSLGVLPGWKVVDHAPGLEPAARNQLTVFGKWGGLRLAHGRLFGMGPGDDNDRDGRLGSAKGYNDSRLADSKYPYNIHLDQPDQGLVLFAYDVIGSSPASAPAAASQAFRPELKPAFAYRFRSAHVPQHGPNDAESYLETDGFYRNKSWLVDGSGVWAAWQPGAQSGGQLIHADDQRAESWDLQTGQGRMGQDLWPHLALAQFDGRKLLVYYAGNALRRRYLCPTPPYEVCDAWTAQTNPPVGPAQIAVFDADAKRLLWTRDLAPEPNGPPPNDSMGYLDRSHLVVAGRYAYLGWVDARQGEAQLRLLAFDLSARAPAPQALAIRLGFPAVDAPASSLLDLIAVDGRLFALVIQGSSLPPTKNMVWTAQQVIALGD